MPQNSRAVVEGEKNTIDVDEDLVEKFLGCPYHYGTVEKQDLIGVATGLAWTEVGGDILNIEVSVMKGEGKLILTGKLGDVMQESAHASYSYVRSKAHLLNIDEDFHKNTTYTSMCLKAPYLKTALLPALQLPVPLFQLWPCDQWIELLL